MLRWSRNARTYDIAPDGTRFLMVKAAEGATVEFHLVQNWHEELLERVPVP